MKILSIFFFSMMLTSSLLASTTYNLDLEVKQFVLQLNSIFDLDVTIKKVKRRGFSAHQNDDGKLEIHIGKKDLKFFNDLPSSEKPVESLLTIIAHEYAHFLLNYDYSDEAIRIFNENLNKHSNDILASIRNNEVLLSKLKAIYFNEEIESSGIDISEDEQYLNAIMHVLLLASHENVDSLSIKLMHILNYKSNPQVIKFLPTIFGISGPLVEDMVQTRLLVLEISDKDSLVSWDNYQCFTQGIERFDFSPKLKKVFSESGYTSMLIGMNQICSSEQIHKTFHRLINSYYSRLK